MFKFQDALEGIILQYRVDLFPRPFAKGVQREGGILRDGWKDVEDSKEGQEKQGTSVRRPHGKTPDPFPRYCCKRDLT